MLDLNWRLLHFSHAENILDGRQSSGAAAKHTAGQPGGADPQQQHSGHHAQEGAPDSGAASPDRPDTQLLARPAHMAAGGHAPVMLPEVSTSPYHKPLCVLICLHAMA
jgi:hypothetical protein